MKRKIAIIGIAGSALHAMTLSRARQYFGDPDFEIVDGGAGPDKTAGPIFLDELPVNLLPKIEKLKKQYMNTKDIKQMAARKTLATQARQYTGFLHNDPNILDRQTRKEAKLSLYVYLCGSPLEMVIGSEETNMIYMSGYSEPGKVFDGMRHREGVLPTVHINRRVKAAAERERDAEVQAQITAKVIKKRLALKKKKLSKAEIKSELFYYTLKLHQQKFK